MTPLQEIKSGKLLVVEGKEDMDFFVTLLDKMQITNVFVWGLGGRDKFYEELPSLRGVTGYSNLTHLAVTRDRDDQDAFKRIIGILRDMDFKNLPRREGTFGSGSPHVGVFILPGSSLNGTMLEDLCLKTVEDHPAMSCVKAFSQCVAALNDPPRQPSKAMAQVFRAQAFLATRPKTVSTIGLGALKNYWNLDAPCLAELKQFLEFLR
jgi:hypothetical protein